MAGRAARLPDGFVFVHPWAGHVSVAFEAHGNLLRDGRLQALLEGSVWVVTDCALDRSIVGLMVNRSTELRFNSGVALIAKRGLRRLQQLPFSAGVDGVTTGATDVRCSVGRLSEIRVLSAVACKAASVCVLG
jgi:hypothetical protein